MRVCKNVLTLAWLFAAVVVAAGPLAEFADFPNRAKGAVVINIDDGCRSALKNGLPVLLALKLPATWYLIAGDNGDFGGILPELEPIKNCQFMALGNHSWHHSGGKTPEAVEQEILKGDEALRKYWGKNHGELIAFATPGAVPWKIGNAQEEAVFQKCANIKRHGGDRQIVCGQEAKTAAALIEAFDFAEDGLELELLFHGIGGDWFNFPTAEFKQAMTELAARRDKNKLWVVTEIDYRKYRYAWDRASLKTTGGDSEVMVDYQIDCDPKLYNVPLTIFAAVPKSWKKVTVTCNGQNLTFKKTKTKVYCNVLPGKGRIVIAKE